MVKPWEQLNKLWVSYIRRGKKLIVEEYSVCRESSKGTEINDRNAVLKDGMFCILVCHDTQQMA